MRNPVFDIMKGIGILAMIAGHTAIPDLLARFILLGICHCSFV